MLDLAIKEGVLLLLEILLVKHHRENGPQLLGRLLETAIKDSLLLQLGTRLANLTSPATLLSSMLEKSL